jgi:hypothetical protein
VSALLRIAAAAALGAALCACHVLDDAATSIAYDIEAGVGRLEHSSDPALTSVHAPTASRGDCADDYKVQFSRASALVVWCYAPGDPEKVASSHTTTYHLNYVDVPETTIVDKKRGDPLSIEIAKSPGKPVVRRVF